MQPRYSHRSTSKLTSGTTLCQSETVSFVMHPFSLVVLLVLWSANLVGKFNPPSHPSSVPLLLLLKLCIPHLTFTECVGNASGSNIVELAYVRWYGESGDVLEAAHLAVADINKLGLLVNTTLQLRVMEYGTDDDFARKMANLTTLQVDGKLQLIGGIGAYRTEDTVVGAKLFASVGVPLITYASSSMRLSMNDVMARHLVVRTCSIPSYHKPELP